MVTPYTPNPDNFPIVVNLFDDAAPPDASQFNPAYEGGLDRTANSRAWLSSISLGNWNPASSPGTAGVNNAAYAWDPLVQRWCCAVNEGGTDVLTSTVDGGRTWNAVHVLSTSPLAITATNQTGYILVFEGGASGTIDRVDNAGNFATGTTGLANATGATFDYFHDVFAGASVADTNLFAFVQTGGNFVGHWWIGADANGYLTGNWLDASANLPAAFASGANHVGQFLVANTTGGLRAAVLGDIEVVALCGVTPGTDTSHLMSVTSNAPAANTIADITANLPAPGPGFIIGGLTYDTVNELWGLLLTTVAAGTYLYSSPDLVTWTQVKHFAQYNGPQGGLASSGGTWGVWLGTNNASPDGSNRVLYSWNVAQKGAAATWQAAAMDLPLVGAGSTVPGTIVSNGRGFLVGQVLSSSSQAKAQISFGAGLSSGSGIY